MLNSRITSKKTAKFMLIDDKDGTVHRPKTIPQKRKGLTKCLAAVVCMCLFAGIACIDGIKFALEVLAYGQLVNFTAELIWRLILLLEELIFHYSSRYKNNYEKLLCHVFHFPTSSVILFFVILLFIMWSFMKDGVIDLNNRPWMLILFEQFLLKKIFPMEQAPIYKSLKIDEPDGLNYGSGMAYSFFYGYLKLALEQNGREDKNLTELIENYSDSQGVRVPVAKLFILIPKSSRCMENLMNENFPYIEESTSLEEKKFTVAAVKDRVYKNSVYKIHDIKRNRKVYICAEYASPLRTFSKGFDYSGPHAGNYKTHLDDIVLQFYLTLKELVRADVEIRNLCDLIYYEDMDEHGNVRDVAEILLARVRKFEQQSKKSM